MVPRQQQDQRIHQRQVERRDDADALRRPDATGRFRADRHVGRAGIERGVEERPEEGREEQHFRGDEQDHAVAQAELDHGGVIDARLCDDVAPPPVHDAQHQQQSGGERPPVHRLHDGLDAGAQHARMQRKPEAQRQQERGERTQGRPRAGVDQMIGMLGSTAGHVHPPFPISLPGTPPSKVLARSVFASKKVYESVMVRMLS